MIEQLANLPRITLIDGLTLDDINNEMVAAYEQRYREITGRPLELTRADTETLKLYAGATMIYHVLMLMEAAGYDNMLATAQGAALDGLAALKGVHRLPPQRAQVMVRFTLSAALEDPATIPLGTKVSAGTGIYFATTEQVDIPAGELEADIPCICDTAGAQGSGIPAGKITTLVDRLPYVSTVKSITDTQGGTDVESDGSLRERTYLAPSRFSTAGPYDAYMFHTRSYSQSISSVDIYSPPPGADYDKTVEIHVRTKDGHPVDSAFVDGLREYVAAYSEGIANVDVCTSRPGGEVEIRVLLEHGELPNEAFLEGLRAHLNDDKIRPLTDHLTTVAAPTVETYDLDVQYWIARSSASRAVTIQAAVQQAVNDFIDWQAAEIGRDLNPSELTRRMVEAGAKRVVVSEPSFTVMPHTAVAINGSRIVRYGGIEDD